MANKDGLYDAADWLKERLYAYKVLDVEEQKVISSFIDKDDAFEYACGRPFQVCVLYEGRVINR
jgi:hypothetical protein